MNDELLAYIENLWGDPAEYKVLASERMLRLNQALMQQQRSEDRDIRTGLMSGAAFLLSAFSIADRYAYRKKFPRILVCDDVMVRGRRICDLIETFRRIIKDRLSATGVAVSGKQVDEDLYRALGVYVFARSADKELLIDSSRYRILRAQILPATDLTGLIVQITSYLRDTGAVNTPYLLSVRLPWYQLAQADLSAGGFSYSGMQQYVFLKDRSRYVTETACICCHSGDKGGVLTGMPVLEDMDMQSFDRLCRYTAGRMKKDMRHSQMAAYLRMDDRNLAAAKLQLLMFLYSILCTADFCRQVLDIRGAELYNILVSRLDICFINFGGNELFRYEVLCLFRYLSSPGADTSGFWDMPDQASGKQDTGYKDNTRSDFTPVPAPGKNRERKIYENAEDIFCETGMDSGYDACRRIRHCEKYSMGEDPGVISLRYYLQLMDRKKNSRGDSIGCLFGLMGNGTVSMITKQDGCMIRTSLQTTGTSSMILAERFRILIPAFAEIERKCRRKGICESDAVMGFIEHILQYDHSSSGCFDERDKPVMESLRRKKLLLLCIYSAGQDFTGWNDCLERCKTASVPDRASEIFTIVRQNPPPLQAVGVFNGSEIQKRKDYYLALAKNRQL